MGRLRHPPRGIEPNLIQKSRKSALLESLPKREATFIEPMECAPLSKVPDGPNWLYEIKPDGYEMISSKST